MATIRQQARAAYGYLVADQSLWVRTAYRLWTVRPLCLWCKKAPLQLRKCGLWRYI